MSTVVRFPRNTLGRDLAVGDVHGHFPRLREALDVVGFEPARDRLFSVGDLVDRGPCSEAVLQWLDQPWFHPVQGNHEALAINHVRGRWLDYDMYRAAGGGWFLDLQPEQQVLFAERFEALPLALEIDTAQGPVGILHADCPCLRWADLLASLQQLPLGPQVAEVCQWSRQRLQDGNTRGVDGLRALLVGHTPQREVRVLGNVWHIDTGGWRNGHFTVLDLATLEVAQPRSRR